jgi:hypothetical protein
MPTDDSYAVTYDSFPGSPLKHATRLLGPSAAVQLAARLVRGMLDRALTDGADPAASPLIAARTAQLGRGSTRARIADGLERLALSADNPRGRARILPSCAAILGNRSELLELAAMLRGDRPLYARGVAMLNVILTDGTGAAYTDRSGAALTRQLQIARASLAS